jgi:hypothetical protein
MRSVFREQADDLISCLGPVVLALHRVCLANGFGLSRDPFANHFVSLVACGSLRIITVN